MEAYGPGLFRDATYPTPDRVIPWHEYWWWYHRIPQVDAIRKHRAFTAAVQAAVLTGGTAESAAKVVQTEREWLETAYPESAP